MPVSLAVYASLDPASSCAAFPSAPAPVTSAAMLGKPVSDTNVITCHLGAFIWAVANTNTPSFRLNVASVIA